MNERAVGAVANPADHRLAETIAVETGELLVEFREQAFSQPYSPWAVQDEADQMAHRFIVQRLADERPDDEVLSEEGHDDRARLGHDRVWIVDPLDGSNSYSDKGADDWAVHIALAIDGQPECGAVAMPSLGDVVSTAEPATVPPSLRERPLIVVSRQTWHWHGYELEAALDADVVGFGSAGAKAMAVIRGSADAYLTSGGLYEWDSCAPVAAALAAGLHASRLDGQAPDYNNHDLFAPGLLICRHEMADPILSLIDLG